MAQLGWRPAGDAERALQAVALECWEDASSFGCSAVTPLLLALQDEDSKVSQQAAAALLRIQDPLAAPPLLEGVRAIYFDKRKPVIEALSNLGGGAVAALIAALEDEDEEVKKAAAISLGKIKDARAVEPLAETLFASRKNLAIRSVVAAALESLGWEPPDNAQRAWFVAALVNARRLPVKSLWDLGAAAVDPLIAELEERRYLVAYTAARLLGEIGDPRAVEPLIEALKDRTDEVRKEAAKALARIGDPRAIEPLVKALEDSRQEVLIAVAEALSRLGDSRGVDALVSLCKSENYSVGEAIAVLTRILEHSADLISPGSLRAIAALGPAYQVSNLTDVRGCTYGREKQAVDTSGPRQLARQELIRRGIEA